jgi:hypothetical protein
MILDDACDFDNSASEEERKWRKPVLQRDAAFCSLSVLAIALLFLSPHFYHEAQFDQ